MAIADELTKLEANRANIVAAINSKGGELAENAGLAACPEAISQLSSAGGTTSWTGHVDEAGLRYIGWNDEDIANLKANICWDAEQDADYAVPQDHKDLWDACEKVVVNGRTMIAYSELSKWKDVAIHCRYLPIIDTSIITNASDMLQNMFSLIAVPMIDFRNCVYMDNVFSGCYSLIAINLPYLSKCTTTYRMCINCTSLSKINPFKSPFVTNMSGMFQGCSSLKTIPLLDTSAVTNMSSMFQGCSSLKTIPLLDTSAVTNMSSMFQGCSSLKTIQINMSAATTIKQMHYLCTSLESVIYTFSVKTSNMDMNSYRGNLTRIEFTQVCSQASATSQNSLITRSMEYALPRRCVNYTLIKEVCEMMLRGIPNYTADSYPMYFESGSTVDDDAAGTLQSLVEQCQAMGWAIYNLTINPYTE